MWRMRAMCGRGRVMCGGGGGCVEGEGDLWRVG